MQNVSVVIKQRKLQKIYKAHANEVYRICLHYLKDEKKAQDITEQVFLELYKKMDEVNSNHVFAYLAQLAKRLSTQEHVHEFANGEVTQ